jgi:hypothetical protein
MTPGSSIDVPARMIELDGEWDAERDVWIVPHENAAALLDLLAALWAEEPAGQGHELA